MFFVHKFRFYVGFACDKFKKQRWKCKKKTERYKVKRSEINPALLTKLLYNVVHVISSYMFAIWIFIVQSEYLHINMPYGKMENKNRWFQFQLDNVGIINMEIYVFIVWQGYKLKERFVLHGLDK